MRRLDGASLRANLLKTSVWSSSWLNGIRLFQGLGREEFGKISKGRKPVQVDLILGIAIWVIIFLIWYVKTYPEKVKGIFHYQWKKPSSKLQQRPKAARKDKVSAGSNKNFKSLVEMVENICAKDTFYGSDAASMVEGVKQIMEMEPASGQIWEAYALDSLETAEIVCDDCRIPVSKTVKKTGVKISCRKCGKWLALKNSKVTLIDPSRADLEDWEK